MNQDPGILCFNHCGFRVFCKEIPEHCPVCRSDISQCLNLLPFRVPYPFMRASQYPCAVVIRPTNGDFLHDYKPPMDLHIGVTTSKGQVLEYDGEGLHSDRSFAWNQCMVVYQANEEDCIAKWDKMLDEVASHDCWTSLRYNEETFNCYTFVLAFLRCLSVNTVSEFARSKTKFCEFYVLPLTRNACKYINLYRRVNDSGYFVSRSQNM